MTIATPMPPDPGYERRKDRARDIQAEQSRTGRDIGKPPAVVNPERRDAARETFRLFCEAYFPQTFRLAWSPDHIKVIAKIEQAVLRGGLFAMAMPRGSGKTTLAECACLWAVLYGHRDFVCLIGASAGQSAETLDSIKIEVETNELLAEDFPEVCYPIGRLEGIANRCAGQLCQGERTHITWTADEIVLPTVKGSVASGAIIKVTGITGRIRGMKFKRPDGQSVRPSLVVLDDPQTDESASSPSQCAKREGIVAGAVLGLAGPGRKIAGIMPCTVVRPGDMADSILNREKHPEWNGERTKLVYSWSTDEKLWTRYGELRADGLRAGDNGVAGTEFYRLNRAAMDAGSVIAWAERHNPDELSALQHAWNLRLDHGEAAFFAEYQNEPLPLIAVSDELTAEHVAGKLNRVPRGIIPAGCNHVTMFIDVQGSALYYTVAAWDDHFTGGVIDYGTFPDQQRPYFTLRDIKRTLGLVCRAGGLEGNIYEGLERLTADMLGREWTRADGAKLRIGRCMIDANWGTSTDVVYKFCRQSAHSAIIMPSHGKYIGASSSPINQWPRKPGETRNPNWIIPGVVGKRAIRHILFDTNFWKSFIMARLAQPQGEHGCLALFGDKPELHRLFADHIKAEYRVKTEGRGRTVDEWKLHPGGPDNHWLDGLVGCAVGASMMGAGLFGAETPVGAKREPVSFAELQRKARSERH